MYTGLLLRCSTACFVLFMLIILFTRKNYFYDAYVRKTSVVRKDISKYDTTYPSWISKCTDVYLDIGSNVGVQVRKLFEPENYENIRLKQQQKKTLKKVLNLYTEAFGSPSKRNGRICAFGFEPNPKHRNILRHLEMIYHAKGWKVHFFPFAVTDKNTYLTLYSNERNKMDDAASLYERNGVKKKFTVKGISLAEFIEEHFKHGQIKLVKLDIEGSEYEVLTDLLYKNMLCQEKIKAMYIEFHEHLFKKDSWLLHYKSSDELLKTIKNQKKCNSTDIYVIDDESFSLEYT